MPRVSISIGKVKARIWEEQVQDIPVEKRETVVNKINKEQDAWINKAGGR